MPDDSPPSPRRRVRRGTGRVTLADVAKIAGVSTQTVSRVLNTPETVPPGTRAHVRQAIEQAGYVPNLIAGGLASGRSKLVAALVPSIGSQVFQETLEALSKTLAAHGYQLMLGESGHDDRYEEEVIDNLIRRRPDGIVLMRLVRSAQARQRLQASRIPVVETWDLTPEPVDMLIGFSHEEIGRSVARFFVGQGRRQPALLTGDDPRALRRGEAYMKELVALRPESPTVPVARVPAPASLGAGRLGISRLLEQSSDIDAVFCSTDMVALGVLIEAQRRGLRVPQDLAVVGFGDLVFAHETDPPLSSVRIDGSLIGQRAGQHVVSRAEGWPVTVPVMDVGFSLVRRGST